MARTRARRVGLVGIALITLAGSGSWIGWHFTELRAGWVARQLRTATDEGQRVAAGERLLDLGEPGLTCALELVGSGHGPCRAAVLEAIDRRVSARPDDDPWVRELATRLFAAFPTLDAGGQQAVLDRLPLLLGKAGPAAVASARGVVAAGLAASDPAVRVAAIRRALHPQIGLRSELLPLLSAPEAEVRQAALVAVAVVGDGEPLLGDEELFRWLHDPDEGVRRLCHELLVGRNRTEPEIELGRRLVDPDPQERLKLLLDLRYDDVVADPDPWLERLSRDAEAAVRAGAARVASEVASARRWRAPAWVDRVAEADPHPAVRRVARHFQDQHFARPEPDRSSPVTPVSGP